MPSAVNNFREEISKATKLFRYFGLQYFALNEDDEVNHRSNRITKAQKIFFAFFLASVSLHSISFVIFFIIFRMIVTTSIEDTSNDLKAQLFSIVFIVSTILVSVIQAFVSTPKIKKIFALSEEIWNIFAIKMNYEVDLKSFRKSFTKMCLLTVSALAVFTTALGIFTFYLIPSRFVLFCFAPFTFFLILVNLLRFIFFTMLINVNIKSLNLVLEQLSNQQNLMERSNVRRKLFGSNNHAAPLLPHSLSRAIRASREIYALVWEMTELVNQVSGTMIAILVIVAALENTLGGYKIFLFIKNVVGFEETGSEN